MRGQSCFRQQPGTTFAGLKFGAADGVEARYQYSPSFEPSAVAVIIAGIPIATVVEGSLVLTASALVRKKALVPGAQTAGSWGWTYEGEDGPHATIRYEADLRDTDNAWLRLHYRANGEAVDYKVQLVTTKPNYGGHRWWFICPIVRRDGGPPRRVAKLYLPSGSKYFGSREAYGLTYTSCQESGKQNNARSVPNRAGPPVQY